ncbi:MAG: hypothetical protein VW905_04300 [Gammaproteobacteria bacterium]
MILNAITSGFILYFNNFLAFSKIFLFPILFIGLLSTTADYLFSLGEDYFVVAALILVFQVIFLTPLYTGMAILIGRDLRNGSLNQLIGYVIVAAQLTLKIFILQVIIGIMTIIGLVLFIVPGLYIQFRFTYYVYYFVL